MADKAGAKKVTKKRANKSNRSSDSYICPICEEAIVDATKTTEGQASVFCVGKCCTWLHRQCAALSVQAFNLLNKSDVPYLCPNCKLDSQKSEIDDLITIIVMKVLCTVRVYVNRIYLIKP